jgi:hypothetical protein
MRGSETDQLYLIKSKQKRGEATGDCRHHRPSSSQRSPHALIAPLGSGEHKRNKAIDTLAEVDWKTGQKTFTPGGSCRTDRADHPLEVRLVDIRASAR